MNCMKNLADHATWSRVNAVLQAYADAIDRADIPAIVALFTPDGVWDYTPGKAHVGRSAIHAFFEERVRNFERTSHNVGPPVVTIDAGGAVQSTAYVVAAHLLADSSRYTVRARYVDTFAMFEGELLIARRNVLAHLTEGTERTFNMIPRVPRPTP